MIFQITLNDVLKVAKNARIKQSEALKCINEVTSAISNWETFGKTAGLSKMNIENLKKYFNFQLV